MSYYYYANNCDMQTPGKVLKGPQVSVENSLITAALDVCYLWLLKLKDEGRLLQAAAKKKRAATERFQVNDFIPRLWRRKWGFTTNKNGVSTTNREITSWDDFFSLKVQGEIQNLENQNPFVNQIQQYISLPETMNLKTNNI